MEFHWLHCDGDFREHTLQVHTDGQVRLFTDTHDSGIHGSFKWIDPNTFLLNVHWRGAAAGYLHNFIFLRSIVQRSQWHGYDKGKPCVVATQRMLHAT